VPRTTPLEKQHRDAGATLAEIDGWLVPVDFGDAAAEYAALRHGAALLDLSLRGKLRLVGPDRALFLHNMVTNDVQGLSPGAGCNAAVLSLQGKMEAGMRIHCLPDEILCDVDPGPFDRVHAAFVKHLVMEDARIEDVSAAWALLAVQGPGALAALTAAGLEGQPPTASLHHVQAEISGVAVTVAKVDHSGEGGFDLWVRDAEAAVVWQALIGRGRVRPVGLAALDVRRIEAGIPWAGSEIDGEHFPMEAGLESGWISYTKGCYLGQETISRLHHLGHVNRHLCGLVLEGGDPPLRGAALWAETKRVGEVTSAAFSPGLGQPVALAYVHREHATPGTKLDLESLEDHLPVQVVSLPLI
jgi:folate-binding protein YgfZ